MLSSCEIVNGMAAMSDDGSTVCKFSFVNCLDQRNVNHAFMLWFGMTAAYHIVMSFMSRRSGDGMWKRNACWKKHCETMGDSSPCRFARFYHCQKRRRKLAAENRNKQDQCPISRLICSMPPPLPFYRRRRHHATVTAVVETPLESVVDQEVPLASAIETNEASSGSVTEASIESIESLTKEQGVSQKKKKKSRRMILQPSLIDMARMQRWLPIEQRLQLTTQEAKGRDADGLMPLHWACSGGPPLSAVRALIDAYPKAARRVDSEGSTALHFAAHYGASPLVVGSLLGAYPPAIRVQDKYGRTPLYHAVTKDAGIEMLRKLVQADPKMALTPCILPRSDSLETRGLLQGIHYDRTPLYSIWVSALSHFRTRRSQGRVWDKAVLLLKVSYFEYVSNNTRGSTSRSEMFLSRLVQAETDSTLPRTFRLIHAAITLDAYLPCTVLPHLLERYPDQVRQADEDGRLPLAVAAALRQVSHKRWETMIRLLLEAYPAAARATDRNGWSPLMLALASGKHWECGVELLFQVAPHQLTTRERSSGLYPALLAASAQIPDEYSEDQSRLYERSSSQFEPTTAKAMEWRNRILPRSRSQVDDSSLADVNPSSRHVSTIFELLRADPGVLRCAVG